MGKERARGGCSDRGPTVPPGWGCRHRCSLGGEGGKEEQLQEGMRGRGGRRAPSAQGSPIYCMPKVIVPNYWRAQGRDRCCPAWQRGE